MNLEQRDREHSQNFKPIWQIFMLILANRFVFVKLKNGWFHWPQIQKESNDKKV